MTTVDPKSLYGKFPPPREQVQVLVIGAGAAGTAAALEAARLGARVKLVDENPVPGDLAGLDVPLFFGGRAGAALGNTARMLEQVFAADPKLEEAYEAGVDLALGTTAWGLFTHGPGLQTLPGPVVGLADATEAWLCGFDRLILATGARDLVMFFEGADQPGLMGAQALHTLLTRYDAFDGRELVILGSGDLAVSAARLALDRGVAVSALVEVRDAPQADVSDLLARGVPVLTGTVIRAAERGPFGVAAAVLVGPDGAERRVPCDTICLAVDRVPSVELLEAAGGALVADGARGGFAPRLAGFASTLPGVYVAGDAAGLTTDTSAALAQGIAAARAALGAPDEAAAVPAGPDRNPYRLDWMRMLLAVGSPDVLACQCEEVTRGDLLGVRPPRYLGAPATARSLDTLLGDGPVNQDQIKRLTRACMGACQARRCREQVAMILALGARIPVEAVPLAGYRAPVRPLPLGLLGALDEVPAMRDGWDVWFGIPTQWVPYDDIGTEREADHLRGNMHL